MPPIATTDLGEACPTTDISVKKTTLKQLPVTLLSGFLGSGKTTLLEHILRSNSHNLRIAVIVNDMSSLNIDASLINQHTVSRSKEKLIQLQNGCICCTLRGDLLEELVRLARTNKVQYVVIESTGISEPMQVAETFTAEFSSMMVEQEGLEGVEESRILREIAQLGGLHTLARLDTTVSVVDAFNFFHNFSTAEFLSDRYGPDKVVPEDERTVTDLMVDQLEFADVIIVNKIDSIDTQTKDRVLAFVKKLNPAAKVIEASYNKIDVKEIINTGLFSFEKAATGAGWLRSLHELTQMEVGGKNILAPKPETEEYGISNFIYRARKPFHPKRLFNLIHDKFIVIQNVDEVEESEEENSDEDTKINDSEENNEDSDIEMEDELADKEFAKKIDPKVCCPIVHLSLYCNSADSMHQEILENKRNHPAFAGLLRSKGFFWLATRPNQHGEWSQAGGMLTLQGGGPWFTMVPREDWPNDYDITKAIEADFIGDWGDRRQELVFIGESVNQAAVHEAFDGCLLTDGEMKRWERTMRREKHSDEEVEDRLNEMFEDGFENWASLVVEDGDGEDAGHSHAGHSHH